MKDPALKPPLEPEEIARLGSSADMQVYVKRTPGLTRATPGERRVILIVLFAICAPLYIHLDVSPFLPFAIGEEAARWLLPVTMIGTSLGLFALLYAAIFFVASLAGNAVRGLFPKKAVIVCHPCGARIPPERYLELRACPECNSSKVYCGACGMAGSFDAFVNGEGCEHCGHPYVALKQ